MKHNFDAAKSEDMPSVEAIFLHEVQRFRRWTTTVPTERQFVLEWECDYPEWPDIYSAASDFLAAVDIEKLSERTISELLYIIAADNGCGIIAAEAAKYPEKLLHLAQAAVKGTYAYAKWELAIELGKLQAHKSEAERILFVFAKDEDEYTRRRALMALAELDSPLVNELIEPAWSSNHEYQRIVVLSALHKIASPDLEKYLKLAELDGREYVVAKAARIRRGEITD